MSKPKPEQPPITLSVKLPPDQHAAFRAACAREGITTSIAMRWAVRDYIAAHTSTAVASAND